MAMDTKWWLVHSWLYFASFVRAALSAAAPAVVAVSAMCDSAEVSGTVTSHARGFPLVLSSWTYDN